MDTYCIFSAQYLPNFGGVEQYTFNLASTLTRQGNRVIIVTSQVHNLPFSETQKDGIQIYRIPSFNFVNGRLPMAFFSKQWKILKQLLKKEDISKIIIQTRLYTLSLMGMKFAHQNGIPFITIEHGTSYVGMSNPILQTLEIMYEKSLLHISKKYCKSFCSVSEAGSKWLQTLNITSDAILYNSVDEKRIQKYISTSSINWHTKLGLSPDTNIIVFTGRLIREKGICQLISAFSHLKTQKKIALVVAGDGPLYENLKSNCPSSVFLLGRIKQADVMSLLNQSDYFCLPSDSEGFPTSVLEAIVCKCYVITAPYGGAKEIISAPQYGYVMNNNSEESIYNALSEVLTMSTSDLQNVTQNAYQRFLSHFTWTDTCNTLNSLSWKL